MVIVLALGLILILSFSTTGGASSGSTSGTTSGGKANKETVIYHQPPQQQQQPVVVMQQPASQPAQSVQQNAPAAKHSAVKNFAVKSYARIADDDKKGGGEHFNSLVLLMESEGIPKDEASVLIKRALRRANGNAEVFGSEIEKSM